MNHRARTVWCNHAGWSQRFAVLGLAVLSPAQGTGGGVDEYPDALVVNAPKAADLWRIARNCGPNCLYTLARVLGYRITYQQLIDQCHLDEQGCSMLELVEAAKRVGLPASAVSASPQDLATFRLPAILHLDLPSADGHNRGHYVLAQWLDTGKIGLMDGTTGVYSETTIERLADQWTGRMVIVRPSCWLGTMTILVLGAACGIVMAATVHFIQCKKIRRATTDTSSSTQ